MVVGRRNIAVMGEDMTDGAHEATRGYDKQIVVSASDPKPCRMSQSGAIHHATGGGQDVAVVHNDAVAVCGKGRVDGAGRGKFPKDSRATACGESGNVLIAVCAWNASL